MDVSDQHAIGVIKEVHGPVTVIACDHLPPLWQALQRGMPVYDTGVPLLFLHHRAHPNDINPSCSKLKKHGLSADIPIALAQYGCPGLGLQRPLVKAWKSEFGETYESWCGNYIQ